MGIKKSKNPPILPHRWARWVYETSHPVVPQKNGWVECPNSQVGLGGFPSSGSHLDVWMVWILHQVGPICSLVEGLEQVGPMQMEAMGSRGKLSNISSSGSRRWVDGVNLVGPLQVPFITKVDRVFHPVGLAHTVIQADRLNLVGFMRVTQQVKMGRILIQRVSHHHDHHHSAFIPSIWDQLRMIPT